MHIAWYCTLPLLLMHSPLDNLWRASHIHCCCILLLLLLLLPQAGGCYVPLDPNFPADRLSIYLEDSQSLAVITEHKNLQLAASLIADLPRRPDVSESHMVPDIPHCMSLADLRLDFVIS